MRCGRVIVISQPNRVWEERGQFLGCYVFSFIPLRFLPPVLQLFEKSRLQQQQYVSVTQVLRANVPHLDDLGVEQVASEQLHLPRLLVQLIVGSLDRFRSQLALQESLLLIGVAPLGLHQILLLFLPVLLRYSSQITIACVNHESRLSALMHRDVETSMLAKTNVVRWQHVRKSHMLC